MRRSILTLAAAFAVAAPAQADDYSPDGTAVHPLASVTVRVPAHAKRWWRTPPVAQDATVAFDVRANGRLQPDVWSDTDADHRACSAGHPACYGGFDYGSIRVVMYGTFATGPAHFSITNHGRRALRVRLTLYVSA